MVDSFVSEEGTGSNNILSQRRQHEDTRFLDAQLDFNTLDCPICCEALSIPIYQCDNGHVACSSCSPKLNDKCPACALPIGRNRCRALENILGSMKIQCPNAKFGCTKTFRYGNESHEEECSFFLCSCPVQDCDYAGSYKDLYGHCYDTHLECDMLSFGSPTSLEMNINDKIQIKRAYEMRLLFAVQCFREAYGVYVTVSCIGPPAPEIGKFSYDLTYSTADGYTVRSESPDMKMVLGVSYQTPEDNFLLIPNSLLRGELLNMKLCIKKLNQEQCRAYGVNKKAFA